MNIQFDDNITQPQAQGIILLLTSLFPALNNSQPVSHPVPTTEAQAIGGVPIPTPSAPPVAADRGYSSGDEYNPRLAVGKDYEEAIRKEQTITAPGPTLVQSEPTTRKRRTKAEIAADEAQAKAQAALSAGVPVAEVSTPTPTTAEPTPAPTKPIDAEALRGLVNTYIAAHSMEAALELLREFNCSRINEASALEPAKLSALVARLQANPTPNTPAPTVAEPVTKDQLKAIIQGYLTRHTEEEAVAILRSFGCGLVSEAMALPADKLIELVSKFNG